MQGHTLIIGIDKKRKESPLLGLINKQAMPSFLVLMETKLTLALSGLTGPEAIPSSLALTETEVTSALLALTSVETKHSSLVLMNKAMPGSLGHRNVGAMPSFLIMAESKYLFFFDRTNNNRTHAPFPGKTKTKAGTSVRILNSRVQVQIQGSCPPPW